MSTPNDLQALLASIRPRPSPSSTSAQEPPASQEVSQHYPRQPQPPDGQVLPHPQMQRTDYRQPSVSSVLPSPSPANTPPHRGSDILSPNIPTPRGDVYSQQSQQHSGRATDLLNLLKVNRDVAQPTNQLASDQFRPPQTETGPGGAPRSHSRNISASDFVASLFGGQGHASPSTMTAGSQYGYTEPTRDAENALPTAPTAEHTQEMLLRLLNRQKPGQNISDELKSSSRSPSNHPPETGVPGDTAAERVSEKPDTLPSHASRSSSTPKDSIFTYVNPFEQLAAASPRKTPQSKSRTQSPVVESMMRETKATVVTEGEPGPTLEPPRTAQQGHESPLLVEEQKQAVSQVVDQLVSRIGREVDQAANKSAKEEIPSMAATKEDASEAAFPSTVSPSPDVDTETDLQAGQHQPEVHMKDTEKGTPEPAAAATTEVVDDNVEQLADSWESAEDSAEKEEERVISVYNFPLRPFISIGVKPNAGKLPVLRDDGIMDISRLRKDFDQLDRSLTSASSDYIVYALAKSGGIRVIRQDDGTDKQIFRVARDRVFNVALCTSSVVDGVSEEQAVLGIGVSGAVYWAMISRPGQNLFELDALESESLIFPPFPASDENTSGGQLKTRAKQSSRHPAFFAIGRGKNIYVVSPHAAMDASYGVSASQRTADTEKFFKERAMKISTGKAGKDFVFSDDDSVIASLDKTGRLRFWDIREVVNNPDFFINGPVVPEIRVPLSTFVTGAPTEKSWPTSVLFIDKQRAYVKSLALRYILVGLKQNHTLQLWDIGLGKAVQEIKFPHENESDAICSVAYHAGSGIIVVAHPTRNSIYFVHLSAPRYNLPPMSQASFVRRASERDSSLPKPDSTACMSGIREVSFASKGQIRSFDLLPVSKAAGDKRGSEDDGDLFELYVMHSRGVTCLGINKEDLGWSADNKITRPVNALDEGFIDIADLQSYPAYVSEEPSVNGDSTSTTTRLTKEAGKRAPEPAPEAAGGAGSSRSQSPTKPSQKKKSGEDESAATVSGFERVEKKRKKRGGAAGEGAARVKESNTLTTTTKDPPLEPQPEISTKLTHDTPPEPKKARDTLDTFPPSAATMNRPQAESVKNTADIMSKQMEILQSGVSSQFSKTLGGQFENLYRRFDEDRRTWDAAAAAKQDQVLRLVSSTLSDNVEKNLARIISDNIQSQVLPAITDATSVAVKKHLSVVVTQQLGETISRELHQVLPKAVSHTMQQPEVTKNMLDTVSQTVASHVESEITKALHTTLMPSIKNLTLRAAEKIGSEMEKPVETQMKQYEVQRHNDSAKIDELTALVHGLSDTVSSMAAAQTSFQKEVLRLNRVLASRKDKEETPVSQRQLSGSVPVVANEPKPSPGGVELAEISQLIMEGKYEEGSVKVCLPCVSIWRSLTTHLQWLQSQQQADLFDHLFVRLDPSYLSTLSPIVALSVGVAVTSSLETHTVERLAWLDVVLGTVNMRVCQTCLRVYYRWLTLFLWQDTDIREIAPKIMDILTQRLGGLYNEIAATNPHDPILRKISPLARRARDVVQ